MEDEFEDSDNGEWTALENEWRNVKSFMNQLKNMRKKPMELRAIHFLEEVNNYLEEYLASTEVVEPAKKGTTKKEEDEVDRKTEKKPTEEEFDIGERVLGETVKNNSEDLMSMLLTKLDNRTVPSLENFDDDTGLSLEQYFQKFENYCRDNFKGGRDLWIGELEKHLAGKSLEGFRSVRQMSESYEMVKYKLLEWYDEEDEVRRKKAKRKFENARMDTGESLSLYGNRLLTLFKRAFPGKRHETNGTLIDKYRSTIPVSVRNLINSQILSYKLENQQITWTQILKCARVCELESKEVYEDEEDDDVVVINFSREAKRKQSWCEEDEERREDRRNRPQRRNEEYTPIRRSFNCFPNKDHRDFRANNRVNTTSETRGTCSYLSLIHI